MPQTFGYDPLGEVGHLVAFRGGARRLVVLDEAVGHVVDHVDLCRSQWGTDAPLPEGIYWFQYETDSLVMHVGVGQPPVSPIEIEAAEIADDHPLGRARDWAEHYWRGADDVPKPEFGVGAYVVPLNGGADMVVKSRSFGRSRNWMYTVRQDGRTLTVREAGLSPVVDEGDPTLWVTGPEAPVHRFGATLSRSKLEGRFSDTVYSFRASRTTFRPYQFKPVLKLLQTGKARLLIADEVGLGKTIEAGLIWAELEARREANRVLVVCPSSLLGKWQEEMSERFGFELTELDSTRLRDFLERFREGRLPKRHTYICSLERLRIWPGLEELATTPPDFDLVIVDEAHAMRNTDTKSFRLGAMLSEWSDAVVFLSATPINVRQDDLLHLLELLTPEDFDSIEDLQMRLQPNAVLYDIGRLLVDVRVSARDKLKVLEGLGSIPYGIPMLGRPELDRLRQLLSKGELTPSEVTEARRCLADLNALSTVITRTRKADVDEGKTVREPREVSIRWTEGERAFYDEYVRWCQVRAASKGMPVHFAMQMPLRLASACLPMARASVLGATPSSGESGGVTSNETPPHAELMAAAQAWPGDHDSKFERLLPVLLGLQREGRRTLLFTFSRAALAYLFGRLSPVMRVATLHGGVSRADRRRILADFRRGEFDLVLANRVASEGLDFEFCSVVINYDLPWNPMEIEQRIGRIDRIGQQEQKVLIVNFYNDETIDERIIHRVLERIQVFRESIGELEPIISEQMPALEAAFDFTLTEEQREAKLLQYILAIEEQRAGLREVTDASTSLLTADDVDVAGLEDDLVRRGKYIGQPELALMLDDWAQIDGGSVSINPTTLSIAGNAAMAERVEQLARSGRHTRAEVAELTMKLRGELPFTLVLDQEVARVSGGELLVAAHPLVSAALNVPRHRHARFAMVDLTDPAESTEAGRFVLVLSRALNASDRGDEIWGEAVHLDGSPADGGVVDALMSGLAAARLTPARETSLPANLPRLARRAVEALSERQVEQQARRERQDALRRESQRVVFGEQHKRRLTTIERRLQTARERGRSPQAVALFESQKRRAVQRHAERMSSLDAQPLRDIQLEHIAACVLSVGGHD